MKMRLLVDGVFFQLAQTGIARVWSSLLPRLADRPGIELFVLDRGGLPELARATVLPFPSYRDRYTADDSALLQKVCDLHKIDVFTTTYYTSPLSTPMLLLVYDMIPELLGFDLTQRFWMEKEVAIAFARRIICISNSTKRDLLKLYDEIPPEQTTVAYPGYDARTFHLRSPTEVNEFRRRIGFNRPYVLLVGSRDQHRGYKNTKLFFQALNRLSRPAFDVLCAGGEPKIDAEALALMPRGCRIARLDLSDEDLARAYSGAAALVYPSLYEGFGLPVVEAMASGCPVITTTGGSLAEIATNGACLTVDGTSVDEMSAALDAVIRPQVRAELIEKGLQRSAAFGWEALVEAVERESARLMRERAQNRYASFFQRWRALRTLQQEVDAERIA